MRMSGSSGLTPRRFLVAMEVLGQKETLQDDGSKVVTDVTAWTLLGLCVDQLFKTWARYGAPATATSDVILRQQVKVCRVLRQGRQTWERPGVDRDFHVPDLVLGLTKRLARVARSELGRKQWRVFDGDVDFRTASGTVKGSVDGVADKLDD